jgi:cell division protein FtsB
MKTSRLLAAVVVLQVLILGSLWTSHQVSPAVAQVPDAGAQQQKQIEELQAVNARLEKVIDLLGSGKVQVRVIRAEEK